MSVKIKEGSIKSKFEAQKWTQGFNDNYFYVCLIYSPEEKVKQMEKKVNELVEESCFANDRGEYPLVRKIPWICCCQSILYWSWVTNLFQLYMQHLVKSESRNLPWFVGRNNNTTILFVPLKNKKELELTNFDLNKKVGGRACEIIMTSQTSWYPLNVYV